MKTQKKKIGHLSNSIVYAICLASMRNSPQSGKTGLPNVKTRND